MVASRQAMDVLALTQSYYKSDVEKRKTAVQSMLRGASTEIPPKMAEFCAAASRVVSPATRYLIYAPSSRGRRAWGSGMWYVVCLCFWLWPEGGEVRDTWEILMPGARAQPFSFMHNTYKRVGPS